ncbi:MAG: 3-hydroxyacyl-ACP dehydratase FabZ family protein [Algisphaera sp.]
MSTTPPLSSHTDTDADTQWLDQLPHGPGFRFVDAILEIEPGVCGIGRWSPTGAEPFFAGHFPGNPIVPGVLIGEALAQMAGIVGLGRPGDEAAPQGALAQIDLRLRAAVAPPADITLHVKLTRHLGALAQFDVHAENNGNRVARGSLTLAAQAPAAPAPRQ